MMLDLTKDFLIGSPPLQQIKKDPKTDAPVTNRGGIWENGTHVLIQGGHFLDVLRWNESVYYKPKAEIPPYEIWAFDLETHKWSEVDFVIDPKDAIVERAVSGASVGYYSSRTSSETPSNFSVGQRGMLEYQPESQIIRNDSIMGYGQPNEGFEYGTLQHLPLGCTNGLLLSIMSEKSSISEPNTTSDSIRGQEIPMSTSVMLYDIDKDEWHEQSTSFVNEQPDSRTRFCAGLAHDEETNSWDLWIYGGQSVQDPNKGVQGAYVLTMPAFVWVSITIPKDDIRLRSMTCHVVGSQLLVLGGGQPGFEVNQEAPCNDFFINVLDMNNGGWRNKFSADSGKYKQPTEIRAYAANATEPKSADGWSSDRIRELFQASTKDCKRPTPAASQESSSPKQSWGAGRIAGVTIGCVAGVLLLAAIGYLIIRSMDSNTQAPVVAQNHGDNYSMQEMGTNRQATPPQPDRELIIENK
ncbi:hypothetical protein EDC01DRAFT_629368 [Geopyxis carbonaria]|nr:hypothetical protein EDC01DRAFT_629368 [Geopyxis carbonaria]